MKYRNIVFLHDYQDPEPFRVLEEEGEISAIEYLAQWDMDGAGEISNKPSHGSGDYTWEHEGYLLSYNLSLGYIGIEAVEREEKEEVFLMNIHSGSVDTESNWKEDFLRTPREEWSSLPGSVWDSGLVEVVLINGEWTEDGNLVGAMELMYRIHHGEKVTLKKDCDYCPNLDGKITRSCSVCVEGKPCQDNRP